MKTTGTILGVVLLLLSWSCPLFAAKCKYEVVQQDKNGDLVCANVFRDGNKIATMISPHGHDAFYIVCPGVDAEKTFSSAQKAAWGACACCK